MPKAPFYSGSPAADLDCWRPRLSFGRGEGLFPFSQESCFHSEWRPSNNANVTRLESVQVGNVFRKHVFRRFHVNKLQFWTLFSPDQGYSGGGAAARNSMENRSASEQRFRT